MYNFLGSQIDYIFFLYGLSFFILAGACFLLAKGEKKNSSWFWLGLFGLVHALNEWMDLTAIVIDDSFVFKVVRLIVLTLSFVLLIEFSRKSLICLGNKFIGLWVYIPIIFLVFIGWQYRGLHGGYIIADYFLGFGAGISASVIFFVLSAKAQPESKPWLTLAGIAFGCYAFSKLVTPQPPHFLSGTLLNQDVFFSFFSFPIQLLRCALMFFCSFVLWMYWYSSRVLVDIHLSAVKKMMHIIWIVSLYCSFVILSWFIIENVGAYYKRLTNQDFIEKVSTGAAAVNPRRILTLTASSSDLYNPDYLRLKEQIKQIREVNKDLSFVYLMRMEDNKIKFLADSDPSTSSGYSPPGQPYKEAPIELKDNFFKREAFVSAPYTDRWGTWISAYAPVIDFETHNVIARIGMDIKLTVYQDKLFHHRIVGILISFGLFILLISIFIIIELNKIAVNKVLYTQRHLQVLLDNIPNPVYYKNKAGVYLGCNSATEKFLGLAKNQIVGRTVFDIFSDKAVAGKYRDMDDAIFNQPGIQVYEYKLRNADGTDHDVIFNRSTYPGPDGKTAGLVGVIIDITEQKRTADSLRRLASIVESSDDAIIGKNLDGIITSWNYGAQKVYGYSAQEAIGRSINLVIPPENKEETVILFEKIKKGEHIEHYETVRITKDGKRLNMSLIISPIKDSSGRIIGASTIGHDITERTRDAEKIALAIEEWERTFNSITDLIFIQDKNFTITKVNKACSEALKLKPEEIVGRKCFDVLHNLDHPWPNCPTAKTQNDLTPHAEEVDDPYIGVPFLVTVSPIFNNKGEFVGSVHVARDISERKKVENALREAIDMKTDFTSTVSHELRTPLAAIKEGISIVLDGTSGKISKDQKEFLDIAKRNVDRLTRIINDILDFQKLESGKMVFNLQANDINEVVRETEKTMRSLVEHKNLSFKLELDESIPKIQFDRDRIIQVLTNLINNALKFTEKGDIKIQTVKANNSISILVKDTGVGIRDSDIPLLFGRFKQLDSGMTRKTGGTGLGLYICKDIVEKHNGKVWVESKIGEGSTFGFTLPVV